MTVRSILLTRLGSGPRFGTVRGHMMGAIHFFDGFVRVSSTTIPFWRSQNRLRKKQNLNGYITRTDLSSIWSLAGPNFGTRKRRYSREIPQIEDADRTLQFS